MVLDLLPQRLAQAYIMMRSTLAALPAQKANSAVIDAHC